MQSLLARLPTDRALKVRLVLRRQAQDQCAVACRHHQRHITSLLAHTTLSRRRSLPSQLRHYHNHHSTSNNNRRSPLVFRIRIMALILEVSLNHRLHRQLVLVAHQAKAPVRVGCHLTAALPARLRRCAQSLKIGLGLRAMDTRARTSTTPTLLLIAALRMVLLHRLLLSLLLSRLLGIVMIVHQLCHRSDTASGRTAII
jgi:hypothetical protein